MQKISSTSELKEVIAKLELKQKEQWSDLKENINLSFESLKPINIIKSTYRDFLNTPRMAENLIASTIGLSTGLITKKFIVRSSGNVLRNFTGGLAQILISSLVSRYTGPLKAVGSGLLHRLFFRKKMEAARNL